MPTGYTAPLYEGKEIGFEEFVLRCSRAWGPTILLRDAALDVLPTEENVTEGNYAAERLVAAQNEYLRVRDLTDEEIAAEHQAELEETISANAKHMAECEAIRERYEGMLARVEAWEPPSGEHIAFKEFVIEQLRESIEFDTRPYVQPVESLSDAEWQAARMARIGEQIERAKADVDKQAERDVARQRWVRQLRESLEGVPA